MRRIVYIDSRGMLCVVQPVFNQTDGKSHEKEGFTEIDAEDRAWSRLAKDIQAGHVSVLSEPRWVEASEIPTDRTFRDAWMEDGGIISHDMAKVKAIAHARRRAARAAEMTPHDEVIAKQIPGTDAVAAERARIQLREKYSDIQTAIDLATTVDDVQKALDVVPIYAG